MGFWLLTRRNHGLEHATIALLLLHAQANRIVAGYSVPAGFFVVGDVPTETVRQCAGEALERMRQGERELAISPFCGTNILVAAALTTLGTLIAMRLTGGGPRGWARAFSNATWAMVISRPLGRLAQRHYTTSADMEGMQIIRVSRWQLRRLVVHWVSTSIA
jgi:hypothetical protein